MGWAQAEFGTIHLGDKRLDRRLVLLAERLADNPRASIPEGVQGVVRNPGGVSVLCARRRFLAGHAGAPLGRARSNA